MSIGFSVIVRWIWSYLDPALWRRNPAADKRERFRTANRALRGVMDFFAIETHASSAKLHEISIVRGLVRPAIQ